MQEQNGWSLSTAAVGDVVCVPINLHREDAKPADTRVTTRVTHTYEKFSKDRQAQLALDKLLKVSNLSTLSTEKKTRVIVVRQHKGHITCSVSISNGLE